MQLIIHWTTQTWYSDCHKLLIVRRGPCVAKLLAGHFSLVQTPGYETSRAIAAYGLPYSTVKHLHNARSWAIAISTVVQTNSSTLLAYRDHNIRKYMKNGVIVSNGQSVLQTRETKNTYNVVKKKTVVVSQWFGTPLSNFCNWRTKFFSFVAKLRVLCASLLTLTPSSSNPGILYQRCTHSDL